MPLPKENMLFGLEPKLTDEQRAYVDSIFDNQLTIVNAKSGTGKTTLAVACASIIGNPLIYTFSPVMENAMGFRPGSSFEKEQAYLTPLYDALLEIDENPNKVISFPENIENEKNGNVWVYPQSHIFMRGINMKDKTLIIDESQNFTVSELKKVLTRVHDSTKVILIGHTEQCDLKDKTKSGFSKYIEHFKDEPYVGIHELTVNFRGRLSRKADELFES